MSQVGNDVYIGYLTQRAAKALDAAASFFQVFGSVGVGDAELRRKAEGCTEDDGDTSFFQQLSGKGLVVLDHHVVFGLHAQCTFAGWVDVECPLWCGTVEALGLI